MRNRPQLIQAIYQRITVKGTEFAGATPPTAEWHGLARRSRRRLECAMAGPTGFEPAISSVTGWHVWPLHHGPAEG
jgi:hypothetical protein